MKLSKIAILILAPAFIWGCSKGFCPSGSNTSTDTTKEVVATINGQPILMTELDSSINSQLQRLDSQRYQVRKQGLDELIEEKIIENAAKSKGQKPEEFLQQEAFAQIKKPSEEEIKAIYEARKGKSGIKFDEVKDQISTYLEQSQKAKARQDLIAKLSTDTKIDILLDPPRVEINLDNAPGMGPKDAKITLVEFSDYQCPFCKRVRETIWQLMDEYKDQVRYYFLDFPLSFHKQAQKAHEASRCAGDQDKYFEYNKKIFNNQGNIAVTDLKNYAKELNLNLDKFNKCLDSGKYAQVVQDSVEEGIRVGVTGTPAFFINGIQLTGAQPITAFKDVIESELKK
ncbi:MAG: thioredoxin domain-containing protein [Pseudomonadota bacterium]